jgi:hypothetical protein
MNRILWLFPFIALVLAPVRADEPARREKKPAQAVDVPYRLTDTQHVLVRIKINGKGPLNFIVDTGAPLLFVATPVAKKIGLEADKGWATLDKLEFEGGLTQTKVKCRVETPFHLEGMNGMGLAGAELHGILGYTVLAKYRMEFDFTRDKMKWTPLDFDPPPPQPIGAKGGTGGLEVIGGMLKFLGPLLGLRPAPPPVARGFLGVELEEKDGAVLVKAVLAKSPGAGAGLQAGDRLEKIQGKVVKSMADVHKQTTRVEAGQVVRMNIQRGDDRQEITIKAGEGL